MQEIKEFWDDSELEFWTIEELAEALGRSPKTFKAHFKEAQAKLKEKGIIITKYGRGANARYTLNYGYEED